MESASMILTGVNCEENFNECQSNPCQNGGLCHDKDNAFYCSCAHGFEGDFCEIDVAVCNTGNRCHNGASCIEGPGLEYTCRCTEGYEGQYCDSEINECASAPCQNGAICIDKFASYICACSMGFSGANCEEEIMLCADSPCANQALCLIEEDSPTCYCVPDYHGERCELQYDECQLGVERCGNGGTCIDGVDEYYCTCAPNFSGESCECLILEEEEGKITMDCNFTLPLVETTSSSAANEMFFSSMETTPMEKEIYPSSDNISISPSVTYAVDYTDSHLQTTNDNSFATQKITYNGDILSTTPETQHITTFIDEGVTASFPYYSTTSREITTHIPKLNTDKQNQNITTIPPSATTIEQEIDGDQSTIGVTTTDYTIKQTSVDSGSLDYSTSIPSEIITSSYTDTIDTSEGFPFKEATTVPEISSFFTETPIDKFPSSPSLQGEDQETNYGIVTTSISVHQESNTSVLSTTEGSVENTGGSGVSTATSVTPVATRTPEAIDKCDADVCKNGGTCTASPNGVRCHCTFRYVGSFCDIPIRIQNAAFSKDSFIRHIIYQNNNSIYTAPPNAIVLEQVAAITVRFNAKFTSREGLIMLASAEGEEGYHYVALFLHNGLLQFQFSCGLQTMLLSEIEGIVNNGSELNVKVQLNFNERYSHCNASLHVNDTLAMSGEQPTWLSKRILQKGHANALASIKQTWLHLGGRPFKTMYTLSHNISRYYGFTGCIYDLEINNLPVAVFDNAEDANKIYECKSLACLSSPCRNGAVCMEDGSYGPERHLGIAPRDNVLGTWSCKCPFGYMGRTCERSICDNNPCQFGGTCVPFPESGYLCMCPYGKHGHLCEHDLDILQPSFFGSIKGISSFVAYPIAFPLEDRFEFSFKIIPTTMSQISLLAYIGQADDHQDQSEHFAISFIQGFILVTWNLGSGPRRIFTRRPIQVQPTRPTMIQVGRNGRTAWLTVDGKVNITGNSPGSSTKLNVMPQLFIGGHERVNFSSLPHDLPLHSGFQGCLFDFRLIAGPLNIPLQHIGGMRGRSVGQCGTKECHRYSCQNNGACLQHGSTFTCICQEEWNGILCSQKLNPCDESINKCVGSDSSCFPLISGFECDCPFGKAGKRCEVNLKYLSDVSFSGRRSYLALRWPSNQISSTFYQENEVRYEKIVHYSHVIPHNHSILLKSIHELDKINDVLKVLPTPNISESDGDHALVARSENYRQLTMRQISIELQLRPLAEKGLILFVRTFDSNAQQKGFISLSLQGGVVEYRVSSGRLHTSVVRSNHVMAIGEWHTIRVVKFGKRLTLWVEGKGTSIVGSIQEEYVDPTSEVYLGGMPDLSKLPYNAISGYPVPFRGCVRGVILNGTRMVLNESSIIASRNIEDCDGTPCGGDICAYGGLCWLDEHLQPHCKCPEHSKGIMCDIQESCEVVQCHNNGQCMKNGLCSCAVGWTGHYCEIATSKYSSIGFNHRSYILIPSQKLKMKDKRNDESSIEGPKPWLELQISFNISTLEDGLLLWTTDVTGGYIGIGIRDGFLVIVSNIPMKAESSKKIEDVRGIFVTDGDWHNVMLMTNGNQINFSVDGIILFSGLFQTTISPYLRPTFDRQIMSDEITYIGGFPDENIYNRTHGNFVRSFNGCIQHIFLGKRMDQLDITSFDGANIKECVV
ncbi:crumbs [Anopheles sinensis]|uniref:Crumbs n=1 Tax=Anopheles sinensis TaxID=74873 RepID=A0A084VNZ4_ANOSI|nr:crumbs [Anopheles sinensis]